MPVKRIIAWLALCWLPVCFAVPDADAPKQTVRTISSGDILHWAAGLLIVLAMFFFCVWGMRKLSGISTHGSEKMRVVGAVSLGVREKVILLQVGRKQLVLGVTPGRIDALHVLEGEDCLNNNDCRDAGGRATQGAVADDCRDAGGTTPRMGEVELRREQQSRATQGAVAEESPFIGKDSKFSAIVKQVMKGQSNG